MKTLLNIKELAGLIDQYCGNPPVAVRSSAPREDSASNSFAGLHDSFLNVSGTSEIIKHIKLVWASLYSDAALLYRKELGLDIQTSRKVSPDKTAIEKWISSRQIVGHPAGPGISSGRARLIQTPLNLLSFKHGEVLVCQGVDPNMTFVVPLAAAVVEERGGMLIHGAIIAREYGLPYITGASNAMKLIENGNQITVDGYLGIITCHTEDL
jgi:phosphoenolpyruvate synthase/pyruvate phosphate dikinase